MTPFEREVLNAYRKRGVHTTAARRKNRTMFKPTALVVFTDDGTHPLSPLLKPGFRHTLAAIRDGHYWSVVDAAEGLPKVNVTDIDDLAAWYREQGCTVIEIDDRETIRAPLMPATCVSMVKAVVGIRSWALTPWQLFKHLERHHDATTSGIRRRPVASTAG